MNGGSTPVLTGDNKNKVYSVVIDSGINWCYENEVRFEVKNKGSQKIGGLLYQVVGNSDCLDHCPYANCNCECKRRICEIW